MQKGFDFGADCWISIWGLRNDAVGHEEIRQICCVSDCMLSSFENGFFFFLLLLLLDLAFVLVQPTGSNTADVDMTPAAIDLTSSDPAEATPMDTNDDVKVNAIRVGEDEVGGGGGEGMGRMGGRRVGS